MVFGQLMVDTSVPMIERLTMWARAPDELKRQVYDDIRPHLERQLSVSELGAVMSIDDALPEPLGMAEYRLVQEERRRQQQPESGQPAAVERR